MQPAEPQIRPNVVYSSLAIRYRIMRQDFFFLFRALRDARRMRPRNSAAPGQMYIYIYVYANTKFDAMQVSSSRKSSGASCDIRDYEGARTTRREERGRGIETNENGKGPACKVRRERPGVGLISRCFPSPSVPSPTRYYLQFDCR